MSELDVPDEAGIALLAVLARTHRAGQAGGPLLMNSPPDVLPIATPVVVAELRRILDGYEAWELLQALHDRVDELEERRA